jgi:peptide/nickel transport system permease protein
MNAHVARAGEAGAASRPAEVRARAFSLRQRVLHGFATDAPSLVGLWFLALVIAVAALAPWIAPADPFHQSLISRLKSPLWEKDGFVYVMGTDQLGRDLLSRLVLGARISLPLALGASLISSVCGTLVGVYAGYAEGRFGLLLMRLADMQIAMPYLVVAIAIIAVLGPNLLTLLVTLAIFGWANYARVANAEVLSIRRREYIMAAHAIGVPAPRILLLHILPNVLSPLLVIWTFNVAQLITIEAALSFIGLGIQPPNPSWGSMLSDGREHLNTGWWLATFPGLAIMLTVLAINIVGDRLRDILDPRLLR